MSKTLFITLILFLLVLNGFSQNQTDKIKDFKFPENIGYVNDFEKLFTTEQINDLNQIIEIHENETSNEIAIVSIISYSPYENLFDYSFALANHWGVGKKDKDNGVLIVFGKQLREIRIQVGYGLEKKLKDEEAKRIIDDVIIPEFKKGDFFSGIKKGLVEVLDEIK